MDSWSLGAGTSVQTTGNITIMPYTSGTTMSLGSGAGITGTLGISDTYRGYLNWGTNSTLFVGGTSVATATAGNLTIDTTTAFTKPVAFATASGYDVNLVTDNLSTSYTGSTNAISVYSGRDFNGNMSITDTGTTGSAPIWIGAYRNITFASGKGISGSGTAINLTMDADANADSDGYISLGSGTFSTSGGNITLGGGATPSSGYATAASGAGITISNNITLDAGGGNVLMHGHGGTGGTDVGINITGASTIVKTSGSGTLGLYGIGGADTSFLAHGIGNAGTIQTANGDLMLNGTGGGSGVYGSNYGINNTGTIKTTGTGNLTLTGQGGATTGTSNIGIYDSGTIQTTGANLTLNGTGGGTGAGNAGGSDYGIQLDNGNNVTSATGNITLNGTGGAGSSGSNFGVYLYNGGKVQSTGSANIAINGTDGTGGASDYGIYVLAVGSNIIGGASDTGNITLTDVTGSMSLNNLTTQTTGAGTITLNAAANITYGSAGNVTTAGTSIIFDADTANSGGSISLASAVTSNGGNITLGGGATPSSGYATAASGAGITISNNITLDAGGGNVLMHGHGGTGGTDVGINITGASTIVKTSGSGTLGLYGIGGADTSFLAHGIGNAGTIQTANGDLMLNGTGGGSGVYGSNYGINNTGTIKTTGTGNLTLTGQGGATTGTSNIGIYDSGTIQTTGANLTLNGTGGGTGAGNAGGSDYGIQLDNGNNVTSATGNITLNGTGGAGSNGNNFGVYFYNGGKVQSTGSANIAINGIGGTGGASDYGIYVLAVGSNTIGGASDAGDITLKTDSWSLASISVQTTGNITIMPYTSGTTMGIGTGAGTLSLTDTYRGYFNWGTDSTLFVGGTSVATATSGNLTIDTTTAFSKPVAFATASGYDVNLVTDNLSTSYAGGTNAFAFYSGRDLVMNMSLTDTGTTGSAPMWLGAYRNITFAAGKGISGSGTAINLTMDSDANADSDGYISLGNGTFATSGGNITLGGGGGAITAGSGFAAGEATNGTQYGIYLNASTVNAAGGNIIMNGQGGTYASGSDQGIYIHGATVQTSGTGAITLTGTGGTTTTGTNYGVYLDKSTVAGNVTSTGSGNISVSGRSGSGSTEYGLGTDTNSDSIGGTSYSGNLLLTADTVSLGTGTSIRTSGNLTIAPYTSGTTVGVGSGSGTLGITGTYLGYMNLSSAASLTIGSNTAGAMDINYSTSFPAPVTFTTNGAAITLDSNLNSSGKAFAFSNPVALGTDVTLNSGSATITFGSTVNGAHNLTATAGTFSFGGAWGGSTPLSAVSLTSANRAVAAVDQRILDLRADHRRHVGPDADRAADRVRRQARRSRWCPGRNFINSYGATALNMTDGGSPRWLVYSTDPSNNTLGGLTEAFHRYSCTYGGSCPALGSGNGLLYTLSPTITVTADNISGTYGSIGAFTASYSGFINGDTSGTALCGAPSLTTNATLSGSSNYNAGSWTHHRRRRHAGQPLGYQLSYAGGTLTVAQKALAITGLSGTNKVYDALTSDSITGTAALSGKIGGDTVNLSPAARPASPTPTSAPARR